MTPTLVHEIFLLIQNHQDMKIRPCDIITTGHDHRQICQHVRQCQGVSYLGNSGKDNAAGSANTTVGKGVGRVGGTSL